MESSCTNELENIDIQLQEIEMLQSMFPGEKELIWHDPTLLLDAQEFQESSGKQPPELRYICFEVNLVVSISKSDNDIECRLSVTIILPTLYPKVHPDVSVISNELSRTEQSSLNKDLHEYISTLDYDQMLLLDIISWLQDHTGFYYSECGHARTSSKSEGRAISNELSFMWLYMHHIYNKEKRKNIIHWAEELSLTGFSLPGKPGVVYIEGMTGNVDEYFERLRRLSWKRMTCKIKDLCKNKKFTDFKELCFDVHGARDYHMDLGKFFTFLKEKNLGFMFKELFGVDGHEAK